ncbi:MAG: hypothetical protein AB7G11_00785 [Phycisphaerales bacterium]
MNTRSRLLLTGSGALLLAAALTMSGCVGYSNYPAMQGAGGGKNTNVADLYENAAFAMKWCMSHYPPGEAMAPMTETYHPWTKARRQEIGQDVAISFLPGMRRESCLRMMELIGPGAVPLTPESEHLPIYRVSSVDVNGDEARVTVHRPIGTLSSGEPLYQAITIKLRGGLRRWTVTSHRVWDVATVTPPPAMYLPAAGDVTGSSAVETAPTNEGTNSESNGNVEAPAGAGE